MYCISIYTHMKTKYIYTYTVHIVAFRNTTHNTLIKAQRMYCKVDETIAILCRKQQLCWWMKNTARLRGEGKCQRQNFSSWTSSPYWLETYMPFTLSSYDLWTTTGTLTTNTKQSICRKDDGLEHVTEWLDVLQGQMAKRVWPRGREAVQDGGWDFYLLGQVSCKKNTGEDAK